MVDPMEFAVALLLASSERGEVMILSKELVSKAQTGSYDIRCVVLDDDNMRLELIELQTISEENTHG